MLVPAVVKRRRDSGLARLACQADAGAFGSSWTASRLFLGAIAVWVGLRGGLTAVLGPPVSWVGETNVGTGLVLALALLYLGGNMILAAIKGWSGCEITAAPRAVFRWNLVLVCPLFTPLDLLDNLVRPRPQAGR